MQMDDEARTLVRRLAAALLPIALERLGSDRRTAIDAVADALTAPNDPKHDPVALLLAAGAALRVTVQA